MDNESLNRAFSELSTPLIADACVRLKLPMRIAPAGIKPVIPGSRLAGRALPVMHFGSVDVFLEAMGSAQPGDILVIDNEARMDEGCIGDLTVLEAAACEMSGIIVWGCHRDTAEIKEIGFPVFTYGTFPAGPRRLDPRHPEALNFARFADFKVQKDDAAFADSDGVIFAPMSQASEIISTARTIWQTERNQAEQVKAGSKLRDQLGFNEYLTKRDADPAYSFRDHLKKIGGAIEE